VFLHHAHRAFANFRGIFGCFSFVHHGSILLEKGASSKSGAVQFEMFTIRQILVRMRQGGDRDREIARSGLMGRKKLGVLRHQAALHDWLDRG
jgi:hypothetical protein